MNESQLKKNNENRKALPKRDENMGAIPENSSECDVSESEAPFRRGTRRSSLMTRTSSRYLVVTR